MDSKRILIVEPDGAFALSLAALFCDEGQTTAVAASAADAEREMAARRPQLLILRAELPDLSGFSLCARLRHDSNWTHLPIILFSSDTSQEVLSEHARTSTAASGYFGMPLDTHALVNLARQLLVTGEPDEIEGDDLIEIVEEVPVEVRIDEESQPPQEVFPVPEEPVPPPVPQRPQRTSVTDEDRLFVDRVFQSISERQTDLIAESLRRRPPPRRDLLTTPEGRLQLVREDLRWREAQIARLSEIWSIREREVDRIDERLHERDVQIQSLKLQVEDLLRRLGEARDVFLEKEREHGASLEGLLLEKFSHEKELIEVVAASERRIHELEREVRVREDDLAHRKIALDTASEEIARLEREGKAEAERAEAREKELQEALTGRTAELTALEGSLTESRQVQAEDKRTYEGRLAAADTAHRALEQELSTSRAEHEEAVRTFERRIAESEERTRAVQTQLDETRVSAEQARVRSETQIADLRQTVAALEKERDHLLAQALATSQAFQARIDERETTIREREEQLRLRDEEYRRGRDEARLREEDLSREVHDHLEQIGSLERELEAAGTELVEREAHLKAEAESLQAELERERQARTARESDLSAATERETRLSTELAALRQEKEQFAKQVEELQRQLATVSQERDESRVQLQTVREEVEASCAESAATAEELRRVGAQLTERGEEKAKLETELANLRAEAEKERARFAEAEERARVEISTREEKLNRQETAAKAQSNHVTELEGELEQTQAARNQLERDLRGRVIAAEAQVAEVNQQLERMLGGRSDLEANRKQDPTQVRAPQTDEGQAREKSLAEEIEHLRSLLQERARQAKLLELGTQRARNPPLETDQPSDPARRTEVGRAPEK